MDAPVPGAALAGLGAFGVLGARGFCTGRNCFTGHHVGRRFLPAQEVAGKERDPAGQDRGREETRGAQEGYQHARHEGPGRGEKEESERKGRHDGRELINRQRSDRIFRPRAESARHEQDGDNERQHDAQAQEEQAAQVPEVVGQGKHRNEGGDEEKQRGAEHGQIPDGEGTQNGFVLLRGLLVHREARRVPEPGWPGCAAPPWFWAGARSCPLSCSFIPYLLSMAAPWTAPSNGRQGQDR